MRDRCAYCGALINPRPIDGTDPDDIDENEGWTEKYECHRGHTGRLEYTPGEGTSYSGALNPDLKVTP